MEKPNPQIGHLSFDQWTVLAQDDPEKFESERNKAIESLISSFPEERRLPVKQMQFRVERIRRKFKDDPFGCAQELFLEMRLSVSKLSVEWKKVSVCAVNACQSLESVSE